MSERKIFYLFLSDPQYTNVAPLFLFFFLLFLRNLDEQKRWENDRGSKKENDKKERMRFLKEHEKSRVKLEEQKTKLENFKQSNFFVFYTLLSL